MCFFIKASCREELFFFKQKGMDLGPTGFSGPLALQAIASQTRLAADAVMTHSHQEGERIVQELTLTLGRAVHKVSFGANLSTWKELNALRSKNARSEKCAWLEKYNLCGPGLFEFEFENENTYILCFV